MQVNSDATLSNKTQNLKQQVVSALGSSLEPCIQQTAKNRVDKKKEKDDQEYIFVQEDKLQKQYHRFDKNGIRKIKTVAYKCLKQMNIEHLFKYWKQSKSYQGHRNNRYTILLIIMIVANQSSNLVKLFMQQYKNLCNKIIEQKNSESLMKMSSSYFESVKHHLMLSIRAGQAFIESNFHIDTGLKIMQNFDQLQYYKQSKRRLQQYKKVIKNNQHKKKVNIETKAGCIQKQEMRSHKSH